MIRKATGKPSNVTEEELLEYDQEFVIDKCRPLSKKNRQLWERFQKQEETVSVHLDTDLLIQMDALAKKMRISRDRLISRGIKAVLAAAGEA